MRSHRSPFEVRCPRCNVTFPVETRKCLHCGGATAPSSHSLVSADSDSVAFDIRRVDQERLLSGRADPIAPEPDSPFSVTTAAGDGHVEEFDPPEASTSPLRTIFRSLGGLIWIILLIAFSLARDCGE